MNLREIVNRSQSEVFHEDEMKFVVKSYIKDKKNVDVDINLGTRIHNMMPVQIQQMMYYQQVNMLSYAFSAAVAHYRET